MPASMIEQHMSICTHCSTVFRVERVEGFCEHDHPGFWHLTAIAWSETPCEMCLGWLAPYAGWLAGIVRDPIADSVILFPIADGEIHPPAPRRERRGNHSRRDRPLVAKGR